MTAQLPPNLLKLFIPRPPLPYLAPLDRDPEKRRRPVLTGVAEFLKRGEGHDVDYVPKETKAEEKKRKAAEKATRVAEALRKGLEEWKPNEDQEATADPYKTLFVARLPYETTEKTLRREFEAFGPIESCRLVLDKNGKSRGYAFIEFEREKDMKTAYKEADRLNIDGRRPLIDVERGRTVKGWRPRRLGGGLGGSRIGGPTQNQRFDSRPLGSRFDDRGPGGFRGGPPGRFGGDRGYDHRGGGGYDRGFDRRPGGFDSRGGYEGRGGYGGGGGYDRRPNGGGHPHPGVGMGPPGGAPVGLSGGRDMDRERPRSRDRGYDGHRSSRDRERRRSRDRDRSRSPRRDRDRRDRDRSRDRDRDRRR